jgi:hypothetical protein
MDRVSLEIEANKNSDIKGSRKLLKRETKVPQNEAITLQKTVL